MDPSGYKMDFFTSRNQDLKDLVIESHICIREWKDVRGVSWDGNLAKSPLVNNRPFFLVCGMPMLRSIITKTSP